MDIHAEFKSGLWQSKIDVSDFVQTNITPYYGDASFLAGPSERTKKVWNKCLEALEEERAQLMMLIHIVGDIHCPMHAGRKSDRGGNGTQVKYFGKQKKLHSVWDSEIVESAHRWSYSEWQEQVDRASAKQEKAIAHGTPNDWIEETVVLANRLYEDAAEVSNMSYDYVAEYAPIIEEQFLKGGIRLAKLLEEIY